MSTMKANVYHALKEILRLELVPALGCTEPISIAWACAKARDVLGDMPEKIELACSGNIIKNVKSVVIPGTSNLCGAKISAILGALAGDSTRMLEVLGGVTQQQVAAAQALLQQDICQLSLLAEAQQLHIMVRLFKGSQTALVEIAGGHLEVVRIEHNGQVTELAGATAANPQPDRSLLNLSTAYQFATCAAIEDIRPILEPQIHCNMCIAKEGLLHPYGAQVGACLMAQGSDDVAQRAKAYAAAGSDARMGGCTLPVVINSGSGNQGLTASVPVLVYSEHLGASAEETLRALTLSNLVAIYLKGSIGRLSAFCGAVSAACGAGTGIAFLEKEPFSVICGTVTNTLGNVAGIVCDGAKASCAAKIASSVDAAITAYHMARQGNVFGEGEGICGATAEITVQNTVRMAKHGMPQTDLEILRIMTDQ